MTPLENTKVLYVGDCVTIFANMDGVRAFTEIFLYIIDNNFIMLTTYNKYFMCRFVFNIALQ